MNHPDPHPASPSLPRATRPVLRYRANMLMADTLPVISESHLHVVVNDTPLATLLCSPSSLRELVYGFLYNEEIIDGAGEITACCLDEAQSTAYVSVAKDPQLPVCPVRSSGFGGCALTLASSQVDGEMPCAAAETPPLPWVIEAMERMQNRAVEYAATRGMHCSALFAGAEMVGHFEDIGRHNTFDKLAGLCLLNGIDPRGCLLTTTGRVSGEMMRKACRLGVATVASLSGPTSAAVDLAVEAHRGLLGYVRNGAATVYAGYAVACPRGEAQVVGI